MSLETQDDFNRETVERLDRIERNIAGMGETLNTIVDSVNSFMEGAGKFMNSGGLGKVMGMLGNRGGENG